MARNSLYIFVEGSDDLLFFDSVVKPMFRRRYCSVIIREYACMKNEKCCAFLRGVRAAGNDYLCIGDIDQAPCITRKKQVIHARFGDNDDSKVHVIVREIESWYLAGLTKAVSQSLRVRHFTHTDSITKEQFDKLIPKRFDSRKDFLAEVLRHYNSNTAKQKNGSLRHFLVKHCGQT